LPRSVKTTVSRIFAAIWCPVWRIAKFGSPGAMQGRVVF
jgi:hypothetical protein